MIINVVMDYLIGGAYVGNKRIADALPQYTWAFSTEVNPKADLVLYMNNHRHYERAKALGIKHIIQRKTGERSLSTPTPDDLDAVICASKRSWDCTIHPRKTLIYNGVDLDYLSTLTPKPDIDLLVAESRIGIGQRVDLACKYAIQQRRNLTILGSKANLDEDTYYYLKAAYPQFSWIGTVSSEEALTYIKGCQALIVSNPSHGTANQIIEALAMDRPIIRFAELELPPKDQIDLRITAQKYDQLLRNVLGLV